MSREECIECLDDERDILDRRLRHLKTEIEDLRSEGRGAA